MEMQQKQRGPLKKGMIASFHQIIINGVIFYEGYDREEALAFFHIAEENPKNEQITYRINKVRGGFLPGSTAILPTRRSADELPTVQIQAIPSVKR
jgi:hypothetical protein